MNILISVIMSVYNGETYLRESVESILKQTFKDFEFIIINDGSTDNSLSILEEYAKKDERIKIINQKNMGLTKSLNKAIKLSKGKYIARQDADDISDIYRFEKQLKFIKNTNCKIVGTNYNIVDEKLNIISKRRIGHKKLLWLYFIISNQIAHGSVLMEKDFILDIGLYNENIKYSQDYELWSRALAYDKKSICVLDEFLYTLRKHSKSISVQKKIEQKKLANIIRKNLVLSLIK